MVAAIEPPKMMMMACSLQNISRSPPSSMIVAMTMMPAVSPIPVTKSMGNSNTYANTDRPSWTAARPVLGRARLQ